MTCRLILTRHAKSSWDNPLLADFDRHLNGRGRRSAVAIGKWLSENAPMPDEVLVSPAQRTLETWELIAGQLPCKPRVIRVAALYHATADTMLKALNRATGGTVLMIGHNPGIGEFASALVSSAPDHPRFHDYPTAATALIDFPAERWDAVAWKSGACTSFVTPRELIG